MENTRHFALITGASSGIGYEAMITGKDRVISGIKNKLK